MDTVGDGRDTFGSGDADSEEGIGSHACQSSREVSPSSIHQVCLPYLHTDTVHACHTSFVVMDILITLKLIT